MKRLVFGAAASAALLFSADVACAEILHVGAVLKGAGHAHGELTAILDTSTGKIDCTIDYTGLTASGAALQGDAGEVDLAVGDSPAESMAALTPSQVKSLVAGNYSIDLKGADGDIKGKIYRGGGDN